MAEALFGDKYKHTVLSQADGHKEHASTAAQWLVCVVIRCTVIHRRQGTLIYIKKRKKKKKEISHCFDLWSDFFKLMSFDSSLHHFHSTLLLKLLKNKHLQYGLLKWLCKYYKIYVQ